MPELSTSFAQLSLFTPRRASQRITRGRSQGGGSLRAFVPQPSVDPLPLLAPLLFSRAPCTCMGTAPLQRQQEGFSSAAHLFYLLPQHVLLLIEASSIVSASPGRFARQHSYSLLLNLVVRHSFSTSINTPSTSQDLHYTSTVSAIHTYNSHPTDRVLVITFSLSRNISIADY